MVCAIIVATKNSAMLIVIVVIEKQIAMRLPSRASKQIRVETKKI